MKHLLSAPGGQKKSLILMRENPFYAGRAKGVRVEWLRVVM